MLRVKNSNYKSLIGKSYELANCWEIVKEFYLLVFQIELKTYYHETPASRNDTQTIISTSKGDFKEISGPPEFGDIILFEIRGVESHIGVYLEESKFLHSSKKTGCVIDRMEKWAPVATGYFRHKAAG